MASDLLWRILSRLAQTELLQPLIHTWMVVLEGESAGALWETFDGALLRGGDPPASKRSIEAMKLVQQEVEEGEGGDCPVCLEELYNKEEEVVEVKEMPCRHRFHRSCIEKWLGMHGSCPVCQYRMPEEDFYVV